MEFHRSTSASRQNRLSSHLNATDVSRGAITSDGRLLTRTGLYRAAHRQHRQPPTHPPSPQSHNPANPTSTPRSPSPPSLSLSLSLSFAQPLAPFLRKLSTIHRFVSFVSVGTTQRLSVCIYIYILCLSPFSLCIYSRTYEHGCGCERDETTKST